MAIEHKISYKEVEAVVILREPPAQSDIEIRSKIPNDQVLNELLMILFMYPSHYAETRQILSFEEARKIAALECLTEDRVGRLEGLTVAQLAQKAEITEEFASFRINLAKQP